MKTYTKESLIQALCKIRDSGWIESSRQGNDGGVGNTLEDLLGIPENNLPIPNAAEWELKTQRSNTTSLQTLFHLEPSPKAFRIVPQILLPNYGWPHKRKPGENSFRQTINALAYSDRGFKVDIDTIHRRVAISFDYTHVGAHQTDWLKSVEERAGLGPLKPQPYWGFDDLIHKAGTKLHNCFYVRADCRVVDGKEQFYYKDIRILKSLSLPSFISAIEDGKIYVDFDASTGHNHGTKFRIRPDYWPDMYAEHIVI